MAESNINRELFGFIAACPTAWHTAESTASRLREAGYSELFEQEDWQCAPGGKYFVRRGGSSLIAFDAPERDSRGFMMMAAHGDSPCFKLKEAPETTAAGVYRRLGVETRVTVLGHVQRGGSPTAHDRILASRFGVRAIEQIIDGNFGIMVAQQGDRIVPVPLAEVCRLKTVDMELFNMAKIFF